MPFQPQADYIMKKHSKVGLDQSIPKWDSPFKDRIIKRARESMKKANNRYSNEFTDSRDGSHQVANRFSVAHDQQDEINDLRESNPFGDFGQKQAHAVFDKLFSRWVPIHQDIVKISSVNTIIVSLVFYIVYH